MESKALAPEVLLEIPPMWVQARVLDPLTPVWEARHPSPGSITEPRASMRHSSLGPQGGVWLLTYGSAAVRPFPRLAGVAGDDLLTRRNVRDRKMRILNCISHCLNQEVRAPLGLQLEPHLPPL